MTDRELAGCPFCGNSVLHVIPPTCKRDTPYNPADRAFPTVRCKCGAEVHGENWDESCSSAIAAWNRRAPSSEGDGRDAAWRAEVDRFVGPAALAYLRLQFDSAMEKD